MIREVEVELRPLYPTGLVKLRSASTKKGNPQFLTITDRGDILFYEGVHVMITTVTVKHTKASVEVENVVSLAQWRDRVYVVCYMNDQIRCMVYNYGLSNSSELVRFSCEYPDHPHIAVNNEGLFIIDKSSYHQSLRVYDHNTGKLLRTVQLPEKPLKIWSLPGPHILIYTTNGHVSRYHVSAKNATLTKSLNCGGSCTTDPAGVVYTTTNSFLQTNYLQIYSVESG